MTTYDHVLLGCAPVPLAGYLKALGCFRLIAEQADSSVRGFWRNERFVLRTTLSADELVRFFLQAYKPTPVVAPWNGGSGFWPKDNTDGIKAIRTNNEPRLSAYRTAINICQELVREQGLMEAPKEVVKARFLTVLRSTISEEACHWLDGALALTADGPRYPPLLGTGGNDGRLDFSNNFMLRLAQAIGAGTGHSKLALRASLFAEPYAGVEKGAVGQFAPGSAGGVNAGVGFEEDSRVNPWDFILTVEGALVFAAAAVRRHAQDRDAALAFPFTTRTVGAGSGATAVADEAGSRAEFWAPLWSRAIGLDEMRALMSEGRAVLDGNPARDGLDFARAAAQLGVARGIDTFQRHGFLMRAGKAFYATPLGRVRVKENPRATLISELEAGRWLTRARKVVRGAHAPASLTNVGRQFEEALFRLSGDGSSRAVQEALIAIGALIVEAGRRPKLRKADKGVPPLPPPPRLSEDWVKAAEDGSWEFELAAAIAGIDAAAGEFLLPFRRHLVPVAWPKGHEEWADTTEAKACVVWTGRDLVRDLIAVLERRLLETQRHIFTRGGRGPKEKAVLALGGTFGASLAAIGAFLAGDIVDHTRVAALAVGLAWTKVSGFSAAGTGHAGVVPFAYAALKPLFFDDGIGPDDGPRKLLDPLPLVRLVRAGRGDDAISMAQRLMRGAGMPAPFAMHASTAPPDPDRLAAALLFPLAWREREGLVARVYSDITDRKERAHAA